MPAVGVQAGWVRRRVSPANLFIASIDFSIAFLVDLASGGSAKP